MQIRFNLAFSQTAFYLYVTLIMAQDAPKRRFLSLIFLVSWFIWGTKLALHIKCYTTNVCKSVTLLFQDDKCTIDASVAR